jgi:KDO2-lipid IV(A) lauroyltransferase
MQWKLARPTWLSDRFNRWALRHGFPLLLRMAPRLPRRIAHLGARLVIDAVMGLYRTPHAAVDRNLGRILGLTPPHRALRRARWKMFHQFSNAWVDLFRLAQIPSEIAHREVSVFEGREHLEGAVARGQGVLLLTGHLGPWELGGVFMRQLGLRLSVVYVEDAFEAVESARRQLRDACGVDGIAIRPRESFSTLPILRALREGRIVALQGDRDFDDRGTLFEIFGAEASFPRGPFELARVTGAALLPCFITYGEDGAIHLRVEPCLAPPPAADRRQGVEAAMAAWVRILEDAIRRDPTQWFTFYDYWKTPAANQPGSAAQSVSLAGGAA